MAATLTTIDVSKWQDPDQLDWNSLIKRGLKSIIIQLSHGTSYEPNAKEFIAKANSLGLKVHGYHFYEGSFAEISFSYQNAQKLGLKKGAYLFLDMEGSISGDWQQQFYSFRSAWLQAGYHVGLYVSESPYKAKFDNAKLVNDGVYRWIANYSKEPANYDIWQYSSSNGKLDVSYDRSGKLEQDYQTHQVPSVVPKGDGKKDGNKTITFEPGPRTPLTPKDGSWVGWGVDSSGLGGGQTFGYSTDGKNFYAALWPGGFVFRQTDADQMWELIKDKIKFPEIKQKIEWTNILNKPALVTETELNQRLSNVSVGSVNWNNIEGKPNIALKTDLPSLDGYAKLTDIPSITGLVKEAELNDYVKKSDLPNLDLNGYVKVSDLTEYAKKTDIPQSMDWKQITGKPQVATQDDIDYLKTLIGSSSSGDAGLSIEAIVELIKHHLKARVDTKTGNLLIDVDDVSNGSIADAVATKVAQSLRFKLQSNELVAEIGGTE